ncbi:cytochrome p450 [Stemphylium lycopersici]|uniref:Cytochrome p450 n=1 Tax=Stemphylium lycopersici TaxID=183478 RepID=A0A364MT41_STELY|nr:cytochrome p450 [Stemphylium lycopersici]RAR02564.1 cytochrome p450 [Stemphylium lycopersici]
MAIERFFDTLPVHFLQHDISKFGLGKTGFAVFVAATLVVLADYVWMLYTRSKMPPGPFPYPIVGNTFQLPDNKPWIYFETLSKRYNTPLITYWIGRNPTVWINDAWTASELLDKRAGIYCSRPRMLVFAELGAGQNNLVNLITTTPAQRERFRILRKLTHQGVGIQQVKKYRNFQNDESKIVALELLRSPENFVAHFERYATSVVSIIGFGRRVSTPKDPIISEVIAVMHRAADLNVPGKTFPMLMETFPALARVPTEYAPWKHGMGSKRRPHRGHDFFYSLVSEANEKPGHDDCYAKMLFREQEKYGLKNKEISALAGNLFGAGSDTSSSTLITAVLAMRAFPETLHAAWKELDRVVGPDRSPAFEDDANLPYMRAFVKEVFRWRSVAIIGGQPHAPVQDDYYNGYLIPQSAWVQGNVWAIHHNERDFPDPDRFNPNRFLKDHPDSRPFPGERGYMTFGWGRRVCSGQALAEQGTWLTVARLVWGFKIEPALDEHGKPIPVDIFNYTNGLNMRPQVFRVNIKPRSEKIRQAIVREGEQALLDLAPYEGETKYRMTIRSPATGISKMLASCEKRKQTSTLYEMQKEEWNLDRTMGGAVDIEPAPAIADEVAQAPQTHVVDKRDESGNMFPHEFEYEKFYSSHPTPFLWIAPKFNGCRESSHKNRQVFYVHHSRLPSPHLVMAPITNKTISPSRVISKPAPKSDAHFKASNGSIEQQRKLQVWIEHLDRVGGLEGRLRIDALILGLSADHHNSMPTRDEDWSYGMKNWDTDLAAGKEGQEEKPTNGLVTRKAERVVARPWRDDDFGEHCPPGGKLQHDHLPNFRSTPSMVSSSQGDVGLITYPAIVNIATLVIFFVYLVISIWLIIRQGLGRSSPWIWLTLLAVCRLTQVSLDLAATTMYPIGESSNTSLESGVAILTTMGLTPLFMSTSSLLNATTRPKGRRMQWILLMVHIPLIISFILIVAGGIDPDSRDGPTFAATEATKAGVSLYLACFLVLIWSTTVISARLYLADRDEVRILTTVVLSLPFFVVDVVYMMCFAFERWAVDDFEGWQHMRFNVISGSVTIQLCMQVIMEWIIVGLYLALGLELPSKAARLRQQIEDQMDQARNIDVDALQETVLWKLHDAVSRMVAAMIMPALQFAHWMLGKILKSGQNNN